ncbi:hypothetical protein CC1G_07357 [Coprinopsis cinerea okayama7|uniref:Uncharacterized protein n=1 Tax=Coprinopsis cinerea (strain Okayama-7 / 130 / ATCC MYA-4618 / FGSC 9003) TaxID=240176 RepID=A8N6I6_COPC7|nr:hypothetical protein CC1G_07357 [Coprinopsis cinerea okayama7\|eukprot:XP_001830442.2 hypothetical protein CC1G_07357 [Coprinopsis cinerea okayama7\
MPHKVLAEILEKNYARFRQSHPEEGRRKRILRTLRSNWPDGSYPIDNSTVDINLEELDSDPYDAFLELDTPGILLRTDYSNEEAWQEFLAKFRESERELLESLRPSQPEALNSEAAPANPVQDVHMRDNNDDNDSDNSEEDGNIPDAVISVYSAATVEERATLENISNITALGLFNDVDIRPAVPPPPETKTRYNPNNVLINKNGWQEIYTGCTLWLFDRKSLEDQCVRVVTPSGDLYGTATGDSWRARVSHIAELQFNMTYLGMQIDFGGLDRWDPQERSRNLNETSAF